MAPAILVVGDIANDTIARARAPFARGSDTTAEVVRRPGGSGGNLAAWLAAVGAPVRLAARVGADDAEVHRDRLTAAGVDARLAVDQEVATGEIVVVVGLDGSRSMFTSRGANRRLARADLPAELLDGVRLVHLSGYLLSAPGSRAAALALARTARRRRLPTSLDPASAALLTTVGPDRFLDWAAGTRVLLPNLREARLLTGRADPGEAAAQLAELFPVVALKAGPGGAVVAERVGGDGAVRTRSVAARRARVVDSTGAGDAFGAGFLAAFAAGAEPVTCAELAVATAARAVRLLGGRPGAGAPVARHTRTGEPGPPLTSVTQRTEGP